MKIKTQKAWGITYVNSPLVAVHSIRATRREAIADWVGKDGIDWSWERWREQGCRAVKVVVSQPEQTT